VKAQQTGIGFFKPDDKDADTESAQQSYMRESDKLANVRIQMEEQGMDTEEIEKM
jgi:hypothetical protein